MTLILSAILGPYIIQVSDRRLSSSNGVIYDDETNKAVFLEGRMAIACTGLGRINNQPTDEWLARTLVDSQTSNLGKVMNFLAEQATHVFKNSQIRNFNAVVKRHAFIATGWVIIKEDGGLPAPIFCTVSNALDSNFNWLQKAEDEFSVKTFIGPANLHIYFMNSSGQNIPSTEAKKLVRAIKRCGQHGTGPEPVARLLVEQIYRTANKNFTVGKSLIITCIPKSVLFSGSNIFLGSLSPQATLTEREHASFRYLSSTDKTAAQYCPIYVVGGSAFLYEARRLNDTGSDQEITFTKLYSR